MLGRIGNQHHFSEACQAIPAPSMPEYWKRNELDDVKKGIELLYEFKEKLSKLNPIAQEVIEKILVRENYR